MLPLLSNPSAWALAWTTCAGIWCSATFCDLHTNIMTNMHCIGSNVFHRGKNSCWGCCALSCLNNIERCKLSCHFQNLEKSAAALTARPTLIVFLGARKRGSDESLSESDQCCKKQFVSSGDTAKYPLHQCASRTPIRMSTRAVLPHTRLGDTRHSVCPFSW